MRQIRFQILALFCSIHLSGQNGSYEFEQISSDAGITFNAISCIVEDKHGFIWFGGNNGLYYYNTSDIIKYSFDPQKEDTPPSNKIIDLYRDRDGTIWVCTDNGLCYFNESENAFSRIPVKEGGKQLDQTNVGSIVQYSDNKYLAEINSLLYHFDPNEPVFKRIDIDDNIRGITFLGINEDDQIYVGSESGKVYVSDESLSNFRLFYNSSSGSVSSMCFIGSTFWIGYSDNGIDVVDQDGLLISRYRQEFSGDNHIPDNQIRKIVQRKNRDIWVGTFGGIAVISSMGNHFIKPDLYNGLPHTGIFELYADRNDGVWVGTWAGGLTYYHDSYYKFQHIRKTHNNTPLSMDVISSFAEDPDGKILVGSENNGISTFDPVSLTYVEDKQGISKWPISRIKSIDTDQNNRHWFGTLYEGLWKLENNKMSRVGDITGIFSSMLGLKDEIWIGDREDGLIFYDNTKNSFTRYLTEDKNIGSISSNHLWDIFKDSNGNLWICSDFGLSVKRKNEDLFFRYYYNENSSSLNRNMTYTIVEDRNGKLWIGTDGGGIDIYDPESDSFSRFSLNESIKTADVYCILRDKHDNMWFSSNQGIYVYYHQRNELKRFTRQDGLLGNQYHPNSGFISSSGKVYFGGGNGFNIIDPDAVKQNDITPDPYLSKLLINNIPFEDQEPRYVNSKFIAAVEKLELNYDQNSITVGFVANSAIKAINNRFRFRIQNYQDEWAEIKHGAEASFTKIPPGDYVLEVMASNSDNMWNQSSRKIQIKIHPPFWQAWYAYLFYLTLIVVLLYLIIRVQRFRVRSKAEAELFSEKVTFFTNVSHEFRTPLTLILSPLNGLLRKVSHDQDMSDQISTVKRNATRLLRLTNQLLDFRMIELNKSKLKLDKNDLVLLCKNVYDCFEFQVAEKEINIIFNSSYKTLVLPVDEEKIDMVLYNLISNALKFSPEKAQIILSLEQRTLDQNSYANVFYTGNQFLGKALEIKVRDNGKGIKPETIPQIFERFFVDHSEGETGTGIGLHICQEYVHMHNGNMMVTSEPGYGSSFIINIPIEEDTDYEKESVLIQSHFDPLPVSESGNTTIMDVASSNIVLYAEDNDELRIYVKKLLASKYKVLTAKNGQQAFEIASEVIPDLLITDVLMPGMDGMELSGKIKSTPETREIPVIMLTALSEDHHKIESMRKGVHTFITKPVDELFLLAKIENIFREREALKKKFGEMKADIKQSPGTNLSFIKKAEEIVETNLRNPAFEISEFAAQLSISKSSLQRKIKASTNLNPSEFIRDFRLRKAVELIKQGDLNIDEIAILVGFNSTSYFIRTFKTKYGKTPKAYMSGQVGEKDGQ